MAEAGFGRESSSGQSRLSTPWDFFTDLLDTLEANRPLRTFPQPPGHGPHHGFGSVTAEFLWPAHQLIHLIMIGRANLSHGTWGLS
jgi:hypothetical protein